MTSVYPRGGIWWGKFKAWDDRWQPVSTGERIGLGSDAVRASRQKAYEYIELLQRRENDKRHAVKLGLVDACDVDVIDLGHTSIAEAQQKYLATIESISQRRRVAGVLNAFMNHSRLQVVKAFGSRRVIQKVRDYLDAEVAIGNTRAWINNQRAYIAKFGKWMEDEGYIADNQTDKVRSVGGVDDRVIVHRGFTVHEMQHLIAGEANLFTLAANVSTIPAERRLQYRFHLDTGIRGEEAMKMVRGDFELSNPQESHVHVRKEVAKNGLECCLPILPALAQDLSDAIGMAHPKTPLFRRVSRGRNTRLDHLAKDLKSAAVNSEGINWRSFRMTFCSHLEAAGIELGMRMKLRRDVGRGSERLAVWTYSSWKIVMPTVRAALMAMDTWRQTELAKPQRAKEA